jgi:hypothetical protein
MPRGTTRSLGPVSPHRAEKGVWPTETSHSTAASTSAPLRRAALRLRRLSVNWLRKKTRSARTRGAGGPPSPPLTKLIMEVPEGFWISAPIVNSLALQRVSAMSAEKCRSKTGREAGDLDCKAVSPACHSAWEGFSGARMHGRYHVMFTSGGRESFGGPNVFSARKK